MPQLKIKNQSLETKVEFLVELTEKCEKEFQKLTKKNSVIKRITEDLIHELNQNPYLGDKLYSNFEGWRSIHYNGNKYRIIYKIEEEPFPKILVLCIGHRKNVYSFLAKLMNMGN